MAEIPTSGPILGPLPARQVTTETEHSIDYYIWLHDGQSVLFGRDSGGDENYQLSIANIRTNEIRVIFAQEGVQANIMAISKDVPGKIVIGINNRDPSLFDPYVVDLITLQKTLLFRNDEFGGIKFDDNLAPRIATKPDAETGDSIVYLKNRESEPWRQYKKIKFEDGDLTSALKIDKYVSTVE